MLSGLRWAAAPLGATLLRLHTANVRCKTWKKKKEEESGKIPYHLMPVSTKCERWGVCVVCWVLRLARFVTGVG
jgi:hypothetical protein